MTSVCIFTFKKICSAKNRPIEYYSRHLMTSGMESKLYGLYNSAVMSLEPSVEFRKPLEISDT